VKGKLSHLHSECFKPSSQRREERRAWGGRERAKSRTGGGVRRYFCPTYRRNASREVKATGEMEKRGSWRGKRRDSKYFATDSSEREAKEEMRASGKTKRSLPRNPIISRRET